MSSLHPQNAEGVVSVQPITSLMGRSVRSVPAAIWRPQTSVWLVLGSETTGHLSVHRCVQRSVQRHLSTTKQDTARAEGCQLRYVRLQSTSLGAIQPLGRGRLSIRTSPVGLVERSRPHVRGPLSERNPTGLRCLKGRLPRYLVGCLAPSHIVTG